jgi:hypothetical protein
MWLLMEVQRKKQKQIKRSWENWNWVFIAEIMNKFGIAKQTVPDIMRCTVVF